MPHDVTINDHAIPLAFRDHGGNGRPVLLLHGLGGTLEAVVKHLGLGNPAVVGHSLGGMLAVLWARRHPECPGIVNLDGLRSAENDPGNHPGMDPAAPRSSATPSLCCAR
ncbi:alpha/beta fold hydrolase [Nonomuraea sp. NPDC059007]|uniref:alpha/beta fold hydrolase n=1 Tax=Nonomuraea sp. NPDC059007 TaxID=3346692 RepID=UPI0036BAF367